MFDLAVADRRHDRPAASPFFMRTSELTRETGDQEGNGRTSSIAFYPVRDLHLPHNYREYYLSRELASRGWDVYWLRPRSGTNRGVSLEWPVLQYPDLDVRGRKILLPTYLALKLRRAGIRNLWLSGWSMRSLDSLRWMVRILKAAGIRVVYDTIDPVCEYQSAQTQVDAIQHHECTERARRVYSDCDLVICVTPEMKDLLLSNGAPADRLFVGRWGTDAALFDPAVTRCDLKQRLGLDPRTFLVGWLGTMSPFKGLFEVILPLVEAVAQTRREMHFVIAGRGKLEPDLRQWVAEHPDLPVTIMPSVAYEDAPNFTGSLDAYLVPTNPGTLYAQSICPVKCFDAMAMGTHLIVTRTRATQFLEGRSELVSLADFDHDSFLAALLALYDSPQRALRPVNPAVRQYSHQNVSVLLADAIDSLQRPSGDRANNPRVAVQELT